MSNENDKDQVDLTGEPAADMADTTVLPEDYVFDADAADAQAGEIPR